MGVSYKTAFRWWKAGKLDAYQLDTGTIIVREPAQPQEAHRSHSMLVSLLPIKKEDVERQMQRLKDYAAARGYHVSKTVSEVASGLNDHRPKLLKLLTDLTIGIIIIEHRDRLTRFGFNYLEQLLQIQGRRIEVIFPSDTDNDLGDDFIAVITSMASRLYGRRTTKRRAEKIKQCVEAAMKSEEEEEHAGGTWISGGSGPEQQANNGLSRSCGSGSVGV